MNTNFAILFDMNGVIIDDMPYHLEAWQEFASTKGKIIEPEEFTKMLAGRTNLDTIEYIMGREISNAELEVLSEEKESIYRKRYAPHLAPLAGLIDFIKDLKAHQVPISVSTAAPVCNVELVLDGLNIRQYFDAVVDASKVRHGKPEPDIFLKSAEALHVAPQDCLVFEDSILGLTAAHRANMRAVGVTTAHIAGELPFTIATIPDFKAMTYEKVVALINK